jgi:hypothetical protein
MKELWRARALESHYSTHPRYINSSTLEAAVHLDLTQYARRSLSALICALAMLGAGCHTSNNESGYGVGWITLGDESGDYAAYIVTIDSITLTRDDGALVTAVGTPELVDLVQLRDVSELWSSGAIPIGTYVSATITLDYTNAFIAVLVNGEALQATVLDYTTHLTPTTYAVTVSFDPQHLPSFTPTYASSSAQLISLDMDMAASGAVSLDTTPPTVYVRPFMTIGSLPPDTKLIRVRGPLINSSTDVSTYTVYVRPFYDEANNVGTVSLFSQPSTVYTINGNTYVGESGLAALSQLSAGITMTAGYTTFQPDYNPLNGASAGRFNLAYVIGGSTLEDVYTEGLSGDVVARSGNTLTLRGSTLFLNTADTFSYSVRETEVLLGSGTIVTADNNSRLTGLQPSDIAVGQRIVARGLYSLTSDQTVVLDATGTSSTNTGSVRLLPAEIYGSLTSSAAGSLVMDVQSINNWPEYDFNFAGNGASAGQTPDPHAFNVSTPQLTLPAGTVAGDLLWVSGYSTPFGSAPPDAQAFALNNEASVQVAGAQLAGGAPTTPGNGACGRGSQVCNPALLQVIWSPPGTELPFESVSGSSFVIDLANAELSTAVIRIGPESIDVRSLPASPLVVPTSLSVTEIFAPRFAWGNPVTSTTTPAVTATTVLKASGNFDVFVEGVLGSINASNAALQMTASGIYDRTTNTFTATSINFVL